MYNSILYQVKMTGRSKKHVLHRVAYAVQVMYNSILYQVKMTGRSKKQHGVAC